MAALQLHLLGASGVCAQKLAEAEALAAGGVTDILLSNEVVDPPKLARLATLARPGLPTGQAKISLCVDDRSAAATASQACWPQLWTL